ncbi:MAG TPA: hypothetical protein VM680_18540 [Verrucomicrobiae bacterium]|nr:hypothetical protein [Verrucomicrobiae bacterium]
MNPSPSSTIDPVAMMQVLLIVQFLMGIVLGILQLINQRGAQKRNVAMVEDFATRRELQALTEKVDGRFEDLRCEIREDKTEILKAGEERAVKLHERINVVLSTVSELRGEMHSSNRRAGI